MKGYTLNKEGILLTRSDNKSHSFEYSSLEDLFSNIYLFLIDNYPNEQHVSVYTEEGEVYSFSQQLLCDCFARKAISFEVLVMMSEGIPIMPIEVKIPFEGEEFASAWQCYKDYLLEEHGVSMKSRREQIVLKYLNIYSDGDAPTAIGLLDAYMIGGCKNIYRINKKEDKV